jgi:hypothetical protein
MAIDGDVIEPRLTRCQGTVEYANRLLDLKFSMSDIAIVNRMPVCECEKEAKK